jgi:hypothetical protein
MRAISTDPKILAMANGLKLAPGDPVQEILNYCRSRVRGWLQKYGSICSIRDLERIVCEELNLMIHEVWSDDDLENLIKEYEHDGDPAFNLLRADLDEKTFATLMRRRQFNPRAPTSYVAVIDCRGDKRHRRFFSRWHEIAHVLTLYTQLEFPFHRSTNEKNATEQMMDLIAGDVGFLEELFVPLLKAELLEYRRLTFAGVERIRANYSFDASFQATLHACTDKIPTPVVLLELGLGHKQCELRAMRAEASGQCGSGAPKAELRILNSMPNAAARRIGLQVHKNMRVPQRSMLSELFKAEDKPDFDSVHAVERLGQWTTSDGDVLPDFEVHVEGIRVQGKVLALVTPTDSELR